MKKVKLSITHDPRFNDSFEYDAWEFMEQTGRFALEVIEQVPATKLFSAQTVLEHRPWTPQDWEEFNKLYNRKCGALR